MIKCLNISGTVKAAVLGGELEYMASLYSQDLQKELYSYQPAPEPNVHFRLFSQGNLLELRQEGLYHSGNGGTFSEYMFSSQVPVDDTLKEGVLNRLILHGTTAAAKKLKFGPAIDGTDIFEELFTQGHLFCNYYFFVSFAEPEITKRSVAELQEILLKSVGKRLKRSSEVGDYKADSLQKLTQFIHSLLPTPRATVYMLRLLNRTLYDFHEKTVEKALETPQLLMRAEAFYRYAAKIGLDRFASERLRLDIAGKLPANRPVIARYKALIVKSYGSAKRMEEIHRLRTVCLRQSIPKELLDTIEQRLPQSKFDIYRTEPGYIQDARQVLEERVLNYAALVKRQGSTKPALEPIHMKLLLNGKYRSEKEGSKSFEQLLLDYSHRVDQSKDPSAANLMSQVITAVHAYEGLIRGVSTLVFVDGSTLDEKGIVQLRNAYRLLAGISLDDLNRHIVLPVLDNLYITHFGREKLRLLLESLEAETLEPTSLQQAAERLQAVVNDERAYAILDRFIRDNLKIFYVEHNSEQERDALHKRITAQLQQEEKIVGELSREVFNLVLKHLHMESIYLNQVLPETILTGDWKSREDFMRSSSLDQNRIEMIERAYCKRNRLPDNYLELLRDKESARHKPAVELDF